MYVSENHNSKAFFTMNSAPRDLVTVKGYWSINLRILT